MSVFKKNLYPYLMWLLPLAFFSYQFILRLWPSLMMEQIMLQYTIDATSFGLLAALYYYGYAGMQIPLAILLDKLGPKLVICGCAVICALATFIFIYANHWYLALASRLLVGVGSAVGFLAASKVISQWFSKEQYARMVGITFTGGLLGAIYGGKPVSLLVQNYGWQQVALVLGMISLAIAALTFICLKEPKAQNEDTSIINLSDLKQLLSSPTIWVLALANMLMVGSLEGFADVWGANYLMTTYGFAKPQAASCVSMIFIGMLFGGPFLAMLTRKISTYTVIIFCGLGMSGILLFMLTSSSLLPIWLLNSLLFIVGVMCCYQVLMFAAGCDMVEKHLLGVTVAFLNSINMLGGSFFHTCIGKAMDSYWTGEMLGSIKVYSPSSYYYALLIIPVCALVGSAMVLYLAWGKNRNNQSLSHQKPLIA